MPLRWNPKQRPSSNAVVVVELGRGETRFGTQRYINAKSWQVEPNGDLMVFFDPDGQVLVPAGTWLDAHWD